MWHLSRLVSWKVGHFHIYHCGQHVVLCVCSEIQILRCVIYDVVTLLVAWLLWIYSAHSWSDKYVFCVAVLEWRRTKQQRLTCITAPIVRSLMGHLSVSYHCLSIPFFICHDLIGLHINVNLNLCVSFFSQCANAVEDISRQILLLEQEIQVGLLRPAAHSLLESYAAAPSQSKSNPKVYW